MEEKVMKTKTSKSPVDLHKPIELQYKNWTIKKPNSFAKQWEVYDENNVQHKTLFRDIRSIDEAIEYIESVPLPTCQPHRPQALRSMWWAG